MTPDKTPSEADLVELIRMFGYTTSRQTNEIARAVLAKWGSPVIAGEPVGYINRGIAPHTQGKVVFHEKPTENLEGRWWMPDQAVYATPQLTQAQAVPLTIDEIEQLIAQWSYELHGDRARYLVRMTEKHHGFKEGGQHG